jgi:hypothetical protein
MYLHFKSLSNQQRVRESLLYLYLAYNSVRRNWKSRDSQDAANEMSYICERIYGVWCSRTGFWVLVRAPTRPEELFIIPERANLT